LKYLSNKKGFLGTDNKSSGKEKVVVYQDLLVKK